MSVPTEIRKYQQCSENRPKTLKDIYTHVIHSIQLPVYGRITASEVGHLVDAYAIDLRRGLDQGLYEQLGDRFNLFFEVRCVAKDAETLRLTALDIIRACGVVFKCHGRGENVFFPDLDVASVRTLVITNGQRVRIVFPGLVVNRTRAAQIHRSFVDCIDRTLKLEHKRRMVTDAPRTDKSFSVPHSERWVTACPVDVYFDPMGVPMCGAVAVTRCDAVEGRSKNAHVGCIACSCDGFVRSGERYELVMVTRGVLDPVEDAEETEALRTDHHRCLRETMLRTELPLAERYVVPTYAPVVPIETVRGKEEFVKHFATERSLVSKGAVNRVELNLNSNDFRTVSIVVGVMEACRKVHANYAHVGVAKLYKYSGPKPMYRMLCDGQNATFCMRAKRHDRCRACFVLEEVNGRGKVSMECFAPECTTNRKRYRSNAIDLPRSLNELLGFSSKGDNTKTEDVMLERAALLAFERLRGRVKRRRLGY